MTEPTAEPAGSHDAREGSGDPTTDPAAAGERAAQTPDGDGGAVVGQQTVDEPGT